MLYAVQKPQTPVIAYRGPADDALNNKPGEKRSEVKLKPHERLQQAIVDKKITLSENASEDQTMFNIGNLRKYIKKQKQIDEIPETQRYLTQQKVNWTVYKWCLDEVSKTLNEYHKEKNKDPHGAFGSASVELTALMMYAFEAHEQLISTKNVLLSKRINLDNGKNNTKNPEFDKSVKKIIKKDRECEKIERSLARRLLKAKFIDISVAEEQRNKLCRYMYKMGFFNER